MTGCDGAKIEDPLDTLPSPPVSADDMKEELNETLKFSLEKSSSELLGLDPKMVGLVKSSVTLGLDGGRLAVVLAAGWEITGASD